MNKFVKLHGDTMMGMVEFTKKHGSARAIFDFLSMHMMKNNSVIIANKTIATILGMSVSNVDKSIKILKDNKLIIAVRTGGANVFHLNKAVVTCAQEGAVPYYKLNAVVILSSDEAKKCSKKGQIRQDAMIGEIN